MKNSILILAAIFAVNFANAQTYTIVSRSNDTIRLQSNKLGEAVKSIVPGKSAGIDENYRLIEKIENGKKSLLFVEFTQILEKIFVTYETDLVHAGDWKVRAYGFVDIFESVKRTNAILLEGSLLGMSIEIFQRPENFKDIINIDGIEFPSPIKVQAFETKMSQEAKSKLSEKENELFKLGLTEEDIAKASGKANECYIAYLLVSGKFDQTADRTLMNDICNKDETMSLKVKYNEVQLNYLSKGYDTRLTKYAK